MGWISIEDKMPPQGLQVLLEVSGYFGGLSYSCVADHDFYIGTWVTPEGNVEGEWIIYDSCTEENAHLIYPTVHAWMPLPKHYAGNGMGFSQEPDLMEHAMFEDDPDWLYKGNVVYEQMSLDACDPGGNRKEGEGDK